MPSIYTEHYLNENDRRGGDGHGITPLTYLSQTLKGEAKRWSYKYCRVLEADLVSREDVIRGQSKYGATAYYRKDVK